jgi:hypothetical protein
MTIRFRDLTGQRFGRLVVQQRAYRRPGVSPEWLCRCDCGAEKIIAASSMTSGRSKSCGCLRSDFGKAKRTHGAKRTPEYYSWSHMIYRCENPKANRYDRYGGRGITVCERWRHSFENFLADMGNRPSPQHTLDRINSDGNYEPANCRWATWKQQANNRKKRKRVRS